jgi:hypothetical protein
LATVIALSACSSWLAFNRCRPRTDHDFLDATATFELTRLLPLGPADTAAVSPVSEGTFFFERW